MLSTCTWEKNYGFSKFGFPTLIIEYTLHIYTLQTHTLNFKEIFMNALSDALLLILQGDKKQRKKYIYPGQYLYVIIQAGQQEK